MKQIEAFLVKDIENEIDRALVIYGLHLFIENIAKSVIVLFASTLLGYGVEMLIVMVVFGVLRVLTGGIHMKTSLGCFAATSFLYVASIWTGLFCSTLLIKLFMVAADVICVCFGYRKANKTFHLVTWQNGICGLLTGLLWIFPGCRYVSLSCMAAFFQMVTIIPVIYFFTKDNHERLVMKDDEENEKDM